MDLRLAALLVMLGLCALAGGTAQADEPDSHRLVTKRLLAAAAKARHGVVRVHWQSDKNADAVRVRNAIIISSAGHLLLAGPRPAWTRGTLYAEFADGNTVKAKYVAGDQGSGLSLLHVNYRNLTPLSFRPEPLAPRTVARRPGAAPETGPAGDPDAPAISPSVVGAPDRAPHGGARGEVDTRRARPLGTLPIGQRVVMVTGTGAVAEGVVRAQDRRIVLLDPDTLEPHTVGALVEAGLAAVASDQGAPWLDEYGHVVALQLATEFAKVLPEAQEAAGAGGLALRAAPTAARGIPASILRVVTPRLMARGPVLRAGLGLSSRLGTEPQRNQLAGGAGCHLIVKLDPEGAGARAGLRLNDLILRVEGEALRPHCRLADVLLPYRPGDTVRLGLLRAGKPLTIELELERR